MESSLEYYIERGRVPPCSILYAYGVKILFQLFSKLNFNILFSSVIINYYLVVTVIIT